MKAVDRQLNLSDFQKYNLFEKNQAKFQMAQIEA
jgi:hypothetical protein